VLIVHDRINMVDGMYIHSKTNQRSFPHNLVSH